VKGSAVNGNGKEKIADELKGRTLFLGSSEKGKKKRKRIHWSQRPVAQSGSGTPFSK